MTELAKAILTPLTADDVKFLTELANELKTQDTGAQRKPVFIQVLEPIKQWGMDVDYADGVAVYIGDINDGSPCFTVEEAKTDLEDNYEIGSDALAELHTMDDIKEFCEEEGIECHIAAYKEDVRLHQMFLTFSAYEQHMKMNGHNYRYGSHSWMDTFFRNPQMERLVEIVEKFATVKEGEAK